ncbi:hypothetical protein [Asaccharospora irregularis]|uniref:Apea-like HEPN domain-containing protein n=1 Tax=Asaccharospora irregularis DSM 2635 TaxID=1121321 RepID=A0A1M5TMI2_9FIRM|nr:hypothetical protein [Asaccharospora irregularis]SHH51871.1 hypothetical protein SAMN04488530_1661 [Asaccharospora irregularis DSM 2635]
MGDRGAEEFIDSYKRSIKFIPVTINGEEVRLPITYSMNAAKKYRDAYEGNKDYRLAFYIMTLEIINQNKKFIDGDNTIPNLDIDDISSINNSDLIRIGRGIIDSSKYLKDIEVDYTEIDSFFEKFYLINKKEDEVYREKISKVMKSFKPAEIIPSNMRLLNQVAGIRNQLDWMNRNERILQPALGIVPNIQLNNKAIESMQIYNNFIKRNENLLKNIGNIGLQMEPINNVLLKHQKALGQMTSVIHSWKGIYNPAIMQSMQSIAIQESAIRQALYNPLRQFESAVKAITTVTAAEKVFAFTSLQEEVMRIFKPFLIDLQSIKIERLVVKEELKKQAETLGRFGWWYISDIPEEIIGDIMEESEHLNKDKVDKIICDFFKEDNFYNLNIMLDTWCETKFLAKKYTLLEEAIYSHKSGKYASAIQSLISNGEGIIRDFIRETCGLACRQWGPIYKEFKNMIEELEEFLHKYITNFIDYLYLNFDPKYPEKTDDFNRHKIAHGESINHGTEANSLKTILYINEIYHILNALTEKEQSELIGTI